MRTIFLNTGLLLCLLFSTSCEAQQQKEDVDFAVEKTEKAWRGELTATEFSVLRQAATERPYTGKYYMHFEDGMYRCAACGAKLFESGTKFKSDCGWPSFDNAIDSAVVRRKDFSLGMMRTEILCANCGSHLGHIFHDGPTETGLRYCINSVALDFQKRQ